MPGNKIKNITALEILDSRGIPTISVTVELDNKTKATASVPSGTSSGKYEAFELRDGDLKRFGGKGVVQVVKNIQQIIFPKLKGLPVTALSKIDAAMIKLDGTENKSKLGANAILGVSLATARAGAKVSQTPLYKYLRKIYKFPGGDKYMLPTPMFNLLNGGQHANSGMDVQEFMLVVTGEKFSEKVRAAAETFYQLKHLLEQRQLESGVGLEGGFSPKLRNSKEAIELVLEAVEKAGVARTKVGIGLDVASDELFEPSKDNHYLFKREQATFSREQLIGWYAELVSRYPIVSIEDGLNQEDWEGWQQLNAKLGMKVRIVGDDLTVTSSKRLRQAIKFKAINSIIIKPNQIGTVSETMETTRLARDNNISLMISHRSGDTIDSFIADLAVAVTAEFIKSGAVSRGERLAKYNRLLEIEQELKQNSAV